MPIHKGDMKTLIIPMSPQMQGALARLIAAEEKLASLSRNKREAGQKYAAGSPETGDTSRAEGGGYGPELGNKE